MYTFTVTLCSIVQMIQRPRSAFLPIAVSAAFTAALWPGPGLAEPTAVCVRCTDPARDYLCEVENVNVSGGSRTAGFYCAARIAEENKHRTCAVARNDTQCDGERRRYVYEQDTPAVPRASVAAEPSPEADSEPARDREAGREKEGPPGTVVELTREAARKTGESLERAADETAETTRGVGENMRDAVSGAAEAFGRATRHTVKCIGSLFDDC